MANIIRMPSLSPTMEEGILESWAQEVGSFIATDTVLAQIETDKAIVEYEISSEGYLRHCLAKPGDKIRVGMPIAIFSDNPEEPIESVVQAAEQELAGSASSSAPSEAIPQASSKPAVPSQSIPVSTPAPSSSASHSYDFDVAVIGAGPGGYVAAIRASQLGLKTGLVDKEWLGGVCLNVGCIPSKSLLKSAEVIHTLRHRGDEFGFYLNGFTVDYSVALQRSRKVADKLTKGVGFLVKKNNITLHKARAVFRDANTIELTDKKGEISQVTSKHFVIATGASARPLPGTTIDGKKILTYQEAILQETLPKSVIIIGSGAIGVEFATVWNAYGVEVTIVEMLPRVVPLEDEEISKELESSFNKAGINTLTNTKVEAIDASGKQVKVKVSNAKGTQELEAEQVLVAIGFVPNIQNIGLEAIGIQTERGAIVINEKMQTNLPHIFAIGDVTAKLMLAHVGSAMGIIAVETIANHTTVELNYEMMPRATYCHPQVASFGITEAQAKERGYDVKVARFPFHANGKALGMGDSSGMIKIVTDGKYGELLGAHLIGPEVTELLPEFTLAQAAELTIEEIARNVHAHPTLSEAIMEAAHGLHGGYIHI